MLFDTDNLLGLQLHVQGHPGGSLPIGCAFLVCATNGTIAPAAASLSICCLQASHTHEQSHGRSCTCVGLQPVSKRCDASACTMCTALGSAHLASRRHSLPYRSCSPRDVCCLRRQKSVCVPPEIELGTVACGTSIYRLHHSCTVLLSPHVSMTHKNCSRLRMTVLHAMLPRTYSGSPEGLTTLLGVSSGVHVC